MAPESNNLDVSQSRVLKVMNEYGIHARPAAMIVKAASKYQCDITIEKDGVEVSGKSIMGLLTMEGHQGATLKVTAVGADSGAALDELEALFKNRFNE